MQFCNDVEPGELIELRQLLHRQQAVHPRLVVGPSEAWLGGGGRQSEGLGLGVWEAGDEGRVVFVGPGQRGDERVHDLAVGGVPAVGLLDDLFLKWRIECF